MLTGHVSSLLERFISLRETEEGAQLETHCRYPSFEPVFVYVAIVGGEYRIHDSGGAARSAWDHGRDDGQLGRVLTAQAKIYGIEVAENVLLAKAPNDEWLLPSILAVANASAAAAHHAVGQLARVNEEALKDRIHHVLRSVTEDRMISKSWRIHGRSGKEHTFDFGVRVNGERWILIDSVSPHHVSIASKYVAFSDTKNGDGEAISARLAVFERPLETDDASLLRQVADLVPFASLSAGLKRELTT